MIVTTTPSVEGYKVAGYYGIVFGEVITGINFLRDFGAGIRNIVGGRSRGTRKSCSRRAPRPWPSWNSGPPRWGPTP